MSHDILMSRPGAEAGRDEFFCATADWNLLIELGNTFGWKSLGTSYMPGTLTLMPEHPTRHDYLSGDRLDSKLVDAADAHSWASALLEARSSPHLTALLSDRFPSSTPLTDAANDIPDAQTAFLAAMENFISYALCGSFEFWENNT